MKLEFLATLRAVVDSGSLAAAAEQVALTPSAVSLQMKQLETYFGQPLFDRSGRAVRATDFAREVARTVERATAEIDALRHRTGQAPAGRVRVGVTESAQTTLLPRAFVALRQRAPGIELQLESGSTPELLLSLKAGRSDLALLFRPPTGGSSRLAWTHLRSEPLVLVVPRHLAGDEPATLLRQHPWIRLDRRLVAGQMAARYVDGLVPQCRPLIDVPSIDAVVAMVGAGLGVSVLPALRPDHLATHAVREVSLGRRGPTRQMALARRLGDVDQRLIDIVEACFVQAADSPAPRGALRPPPDRPTTSPPTARSARPPRRAGSP